MSYIGMFREALFIIAKKEKGSKCPLTHKGLNMLQYLHTISFNNIIIFFVMKS